jgi:alanine dehydrogenase
MIIATPKEIKNNEYRVAITPNGVREFVKRGHIVLVEKNAGAGSGFMDAEYEAAGARIVDTDTLFAEAEMIYKVKEFLKSRYPFILESFPKP